MLHIFTEDMQQGEDAALLEDGDDVVILVDSRLGTAEKVEAMRYLLIRRYGPLVLPIAV